MGDRTIKPGMRALRTRVAIYTRVSVDAKGEGRSVAEQEVECRRVSDRHDDWDIVGVYCDNGVSGYTGARRQDWERLVADLDAGLLDLILVYEPSRATRDLAVWVELADRCRALGVRFCANGKVYDLREPDDAFHLDLEFILARRESAMTGKRVGRTMESQAREGKPGPGKAPFGYRRTYTERGAVDKQVPDMEPRSYMTPEGRVLMWKPAELARQLFQSAAEGASLYGMAEGLNASGVPNPRTQHALLHHPDKERKYSSEWTSEMLRRMLQNDAYLGRRQHRGRLAAEGGWPPLVSREVFFTVANRFAERADTFPGNPAKRSRPGAVRSLLSRLAVCDHCDRTCQSTSYEGARAYRCRTGGVYVPAEEADTYVTASLLSRLAKPSNLARLNALGGADAEAAEARARAAELKKELTQVKAGFQAGEVDYDDYVARRKVLAPQIRELERVAASAGVPLVLRALIGPQNDNIWAGLDLSARRAAVEYLADVRLLPVGRGAWSPPGIQQRVRVTLKLELD